MHNILLIAIGPSIALLLFFYFIDRYDREPLALLGKLFLGGMISVVPILLIELGLQSLNVLPGILGVAYTAFIVAGFTEEFFKRWVVMKIAYKHEHFNERLDGIIYCVFVSLGMATVENVFYIFGNENPISVGILRGFISVPMHMLFAVTMGYYLSFAKFTTEEVRRKKYLKMTLWRPVFLHGVFDFLLMSGQILLTIAVVPFVLWSWKVNFVKLKKYYRDSKGIQNMDYLDD
ncbi:PrsW family glutamic-type intramembrane protease [Fusibacter sp. 3D3]|uniref:PrsW family glutamic-type intramembrane protease n=1 Tax=Fusibacter sp. 3D3 TaxID=1048380 RepID=UPI000852E93F|nr:PrsW family glutamic-type intramembrane protease [Fusibacter sp. 3D3]GAU77967.1 hypothetical protein F3D3_2596 [Fusibacter sp. 3D3]